MPVGRVDDDGRPFRQYRGKPEPLGRLTEWNCPSCGQKVEGRAYEQGCPFCGVGVPGSQPTPAPPSEPIAEVTEQERPVQSRAPGPSPVPRRSVEAPGVATVVTRVIQYVCKPGMEAALEKTLQRALVGKFGFAWGTITAAIVDDLSQRQQDILGLASRQPGVWLGGPEYQELRDGAIPYNEAVPRVLEHFEREHQRVRSPEFVTSLRAEVEKQRMEPPIVPNTGPTFTRLDGEMAKVLVQTCGLRVAYTFALALQALASAGDNDPLALNQTECYALANAIMQLIPDDYAPEQPPPTEPQVENEARQAARDRVAAIQAGSVPVPTFRDVPSGEGPIR